MKLFQQKESFMGIDIGTSSVKVILFDRDGFEIQQASIPCMLMTDQDGHAEMDADAVVAAVVTATATCMEHTESRLYHLAGIGLSCHQHSLMAVDDKGNALTKLMTWADKRAAYDTEIIAALPGSHSLYPRTGCLLHPMYPLSKLLWLKRQAPDVFRKAAKFCSMKEYMLFKFCGEWLVDDTMACSQGFYDLRKHDWDTEIVEGLASISITQLSTVVPCMQVLPPIRTEWANRMHVHTDTPMIIGSGDGVMANLGSGIQNRTRFSSTIGTSGAIRTTVEAPLIDDDRRTWCYAFTRDKWVVGGAINSGSVVLSWLKREFGGQFEQDALQGESLSKTMDRLAAKVLPGSEGLLFLPYLLGERSPDWNAQVRGMMRGLDMHHTRGHIIRAMMEGILYRLSTTDEALSSLVGSTGALHASGGYVNSEFWLQMQADLFGRSVYLTPVKEVSALGAAFMAMVALGAVSSMDDRLPAMQPTHMFVPQTETALLYRDWKHRAHQLYQSQK